MLIPLLHSISFYSLLRGVLSPEKIITAAKSLGYTTIALADRNNLYGLPRLLARAKEQNVSIIIGAELVVSGGESILCYVNNPDGFAALCTLISNITTRPAFTIDEMCRIVRKDCAIVSDNRVTLSKCKAFADVYFRLSMPKRLPAWVTEQGYRILITPPEVFLSANDYAVHRIVRAIDTNTTLSRCNENELISKDTLFYSPQELEERFELFGTAIATTAQFADEYEFVPWQKGFIMPEFSGVDAATVLRERTYAGAQNRYKAVDEKIASRIDYELELIISKGFAGYFLIVEDIVKQSPRTCGRGSAAASIVAYSLGITNVDPVRYNLMFERFLNPGRVDPPDIDIDFAWDERDGIIDYVFRHYGKVHVAMVATHQTCGARMAIREVARLHGLTEQEIGAVTKKIPYFADLPEYASSLESVVTKWPAFAGVSFDPPWDAILRDAGKIIGFPRGIGTHCGGILITPCAISDVAPVQISAKGYPIVQWEKDGVEAMGLVKIDLLGNRSLAVIRDAIASIKRDGTGFDESTWDPQSDTATISLFARGASMGVFYVESPAMRLLQQKSRRGDFDHLVIHSSIIRPAANKFIRAYLERLHGKPFTPLHPLIADTLVETFGIMVYQEDVAKVAMVLAGFTAEEADKLRKIVAKKARGETFSNYKKRFYDGATKRDVAESVIDKVWEMMLSFSGYSFCKPHSASYVQVSFQSAWLKVHYPSHFMAAVLSNYGGFYTTQAYVSEAKRLGIRILSPDVNKSYVRYRSTAGVIMVGLCQIKGLSDAAQERIVAERDKRGHFNSLENMLERTDIDEKDAEKLVLAGATDSIDPTMNRPTQFWKMRSWYRSKESGALPTLSHFSLQQLLVFQYRMLGFLTNHHPLEVLRNAIKRPVYRANQIHAQIGKKISLFGWCVTSKTVSTHTGLAMEFVTFEDEAGLIETVFFPEVYRQYSLLLAWQMAFLITGMVTAEFGVPVVEVESIKRLQ